MRRDAKLDVALMATGAICTLLFSAIAVAVSMPIVVVPPNTSVKVSVSSSGFEYCPEIGTLSYAKVTTCVGWNHTQSAGVDVLVLIGANVSYPESFLVQDSAHDVFSTVFNFSNWSSKEGLWVAFSPSVGPITNGNIWVNASTPTRYVFAVLYLTHSGNVDRIGAGISAMNDTVAASVITPYVNDTAILGVFDNQTYAQTACEHAGSLVANPNLAYAHKTDTYRNLLVGYETGIPRGAIAQTMMLGNASGVGPCVDSPSPYVAFMVTVARGAAAVHQP